MAAGDKDTRLAIYGSLAPGQSNHRELAGLTGDWRPGVVRGWKVESGWGAARGYPGLRPDPDGPRVAVLIFVSEDLPAHWGRLDAFEGGEYERVTVTAETPEGPLAAQIYALRPEPQAAASSGSP